MTTEPWVEDVAKHLGLARDAVYRWIETNGSLAHRVDGLPKYSETDDWGHGGEAGQEEPVQGKENG